MILDAKVLPRLIDISCVRADVAMDELQEMVQIAKERSFVCCFSLMCFSEWLAEQLRGQEKTIMGGAVGFPSGAETTAIKCAEAREQLAFGCKELDMVVNIGALKSGMDTFVEKDIRSVMEVADGIPVKTIIEITYLNDEEIKRICEIALRCGVAYIKTGTGWAKNSTTVEHIKKIRAEIGDSAKIKAAGGVRDIETIVDMINAGCSRFGIGITSVKKILQQIDGRQYEVRDMVF